MSDVTILVDGVPRRVRDDVTVAVALLGLGVTAFHRSIGGEPRGPVCGMGSCHECRVSIDGRTGIRSCLEPVREGMRVETNR